MEFGVVMFVTDETIGPAELARAAEDVGFESLFVPEHTHIPASRRTPWPGGRELPREYARTYDPFVALTAAAAATERLNIGTGVCLVPQHDPITLAKQVATVDLLSGGRFLFGVGAGWNEEELRDHGTDPSTRFALLRERVLAMKAIWTQDEAEFHGRFVDFDPLWSWPKPLQRPHPPVLVGGDGPGALDRAVEYGDAWFPIARNPAAVLARVPELQDRARAAGRDGIAVSVFNAPRDDAILAAFSEAGVERCLFSLRPAPASETLPRLARYAEVAARHR